MLDPQSPLFAVFFKGATHPPWRVWVVTRQRPQNCAPRTPGRLARKALKAIASLDEANGHDATWFDEARWHADLSIPHVQDTLEHWLTFGAIRAGLVGADESDAIHRFYLTSLGRDRAADGPSREVVPVVGDLHFHQHGAGSIQQVGSQNVANVQQISIPSLAPAIEGHTQTARRIPRR